MTVFKISDPYNFDAKTILIQAQIIVNKIGDLLTLPQLTTICCMQAPDELGLKLGFAYNCGS